MGRRKWDHTVSPAAIEARTDQVRVQSRAALTFPGLADPISSESA